MAASTPPSTTIHELEAFCPGCPEPGEVTAFLDTQGFTLGFTMGAVPAHDRNVAPLPAQFHYERDDVMYNPKSTPFDPFFEFWFEGYCIYYGICSLSRSPSLRI